MREKHGCRVRVTFLYASGTILRIGTTEIGSRRHTNQNSNQIDQHARPKEPQYRIQKNKMNWGGEDKIEHHRWAGAPSLLSRQLLSVAGRSYTQQHTDVAMSRTRMDLAALT